MKRPVLIYRDVVLPLSETFIATPVPMLARYDAWFTGTRVQRHDLVDPARVIDASLPPLRRALFKATGSVPRRWLERIREHHPALIHAQFGTDGVFSQPIARALNVPLIVTFFGFDATTTRALGPVWKLYEHKRRRLFREADRILTVSRFIERRLLEHGCPPDAVETHYTGVDTDRFRRGADVLRERVVLFVGRLVEKKGCADLIDAMRRVQAEEPQVRLVVVGDGPLRAELERRAAGLVADFLGPQPPAEVWRRMERASLFALPSRTARSGDAEGLPFVILEAQSMELPVVSTFHAGIPEAVVDGETGLLCDEGDVDKLAANILRLMRSDDLRRNFGIAARARMVAHFDLREQTARLEDIYDRVIAGRFAAAR